MRLAIVLGGLVIGGMATASQFVLTPPLQAPELPEGKGKVTARHFLSDLGEAGKRAFSGSCADCHGKEGLGGNAPRLDTQAFTWDYRRTQELHEAVNGQIPDHSALGVTLGPVGSASRFNDVEMMGKYLREIRASRERKAAEY